MQHPASAAPRRPAPVLVAAMTALVLACLAAAGPAQARSMFLSRTSGATADTYWTQIDGTEPGTSPFGNTHIGWLYAYETGKGVASVFGDIQDWDCPAGELPSGGHDEEGPCVAKGSRSIDSADVPFTIDRKLTTARLTGTLTVYGGGHGDGGVVGRPPADIIWTGVGDVVTERYTYRYTDGGTTYTDSYTADRRSATMSGYMGPMGFDPNLSGGTLSNFKARSQSRTK